MRSDVSRTALVRSLVIAVVSLTTASAAGGDVIRVPADQPNIQAGIDATQPGDMVLVAPGTYSGAGNYDLDFGGKNISVISESGPSVTTIDPQGAGRAFHIHSGEDGTALIEGFTIRNGAEPGGLGGGILIADASPTVRHCILADNASSNGAAIAISDEDSQQGTPTNPTIEHCTITGNTSAAGGGTIAVLGDLFVRYPEPTIRSCALPFNVGSGLLVIGSGVVAEDCLFSDNVGRGIIAEDTSGRVERSLIARNTEGGVLTSGLGVWTFVDCGVIDHSTSDDGTGIKDVSQEGQLSFQRCQFAGNHSQGRGGGALVTGIHLATFEDCTFDGNSAGTGGGVYFANAEPPFTSDAFRGCRFHGNTALVSGGAIYASTIAYTMNITGSVFWNNTAGTQGGAIHARADVGTVRLESSTIATCDAPVGAGVCVEAEFPFPVQVELDRTIIAFSSTGASMTCLSQATVTAVCSDVYGNEGGDWIGCLEGLLGTGGNISADPLFCNPGAGDFEIAESSPCAPGQSGGCGLIGALPVGCQVTAIEPVTWGAIKGRFKDVTR